MSHRESQGFLGAAFRLHFGGRPETVGECDRAPESELARVVGGLQVALDVLPPAHGVDRQRLEEGFYLALRLAHCEVLLAMFPAPTYRTFRGLLLLVCH